MTEFERMQEFSKGALIAELEDIKAEITTIKHEYWQDFAKFDRAKGMEETIEILNNHIAKLKGEQKC